MKIKQVIKFLLDCQNIICPPAFFNLLPLNEKLTCHFSTYPVDFDSFLDGDFEHKTNEKDYRLLDIQVFTKPRVSTTSLEYLSKIQSKNVGTIGFFPYVSPGRRFPNNLREIIAKLKNVMLLYRLKRNNVGLVIFYGNRPKNTYLTQLATFNSLIIQARGGFSSIKHAILNDMLIIGDVNSINGIVLKTDYKIKVLSLTDINNSNLSEEILRKIALDNRQRLCKLIRDSSRFWRIFLQ